MVGVRFDGDGWCINCLVGHVIYYIYSFVETRTTPR